VRAYSESLAEALERQLAARGGGAWEGVVRANALYMLQVGVGARDGARWPVVFQGPRGTGLQGVGGWLRWARQCAVHAAGGRGEREKDIDDATLPP
jgi:hypothetical protein